MKKVLLGVCLLLAGMAGWAQGRPEQPAMVLDEVESLLKDGSYKSAYARSESVYEQLETLPVKLETSTHLLRAAYYMERAASAYQEDYADSSRSRYLHILPRLDTVERALCLMLLDSSEAALRDTAMLKRIPVERAKYMCRNTDGEGLNTTPTVYDLVLTSLGTNLYGKTSSLDFRISAYQALLAHHRKLLSEARSEVARRTEESFCIYYERQLLERYENLPNQPQGNSLKRGLAALGRCKNYRSELLTELYYYVAQEYQRNNDLVSAIAYCDAAVALYPKSNGGVQCYNLRCSLTDPVIVNLNLPVTLAGREIIVDVLARNTDTVYFRVVKKPKDFRDDQKKKLMNAETVYETKQAVPHRSDYQNSEALAVLPALPVGEYMLLASTSAEGLSKGDMLAVSFACTDIKIIWHQVGNRRNELEGYVLSVTDGTPVSKQQVFLKKQQYSRREGGAVESVLDSALTDAEGRFVLHGNDKDHSLVVSTVSHGYEHREPIYHYYFRIEDGDTSLHAFADRPIYRPGDTVHFTLLESRWHRSGEMGVMSGRTCRAWFFDSYSNVVDSVMVVTDDYGSASGSFVIPVDARTGTWGISFTEGTRQSIGISIDVEAYKQPTFAVSLAKVTNTLRFGELVRVEGYALSYTQVPVGGVSVQYKVTRSGGGFWWRRHYSDPVVVASGQTLTDCQGRFELAFVPLPDSTQQWSQRTSYCYTVEATVTDAAGETHEQTLAINIGFDNRIVALSSFRKDTVEYRYSDPDGRPLTGPLTLRVERLRQPSEAKQLHPAMKTELPLPMSREEFARRFPQYYYSVHDCADSCMPVEQVAYNAKVQAEGKDQNRVVLPQLEAGVYRIILMADSLRDTMVVTQTPEKCKRVQSVDLLWADLDKSTARVGETVTLRVGSRHKNLRCLMVMTVGDSIAERRSLTLNDNILQIPIVATEEMKMGTAQIALFALREGETKRVELGFYVPREDKQLKLEIETFRNQLEPGSDEEWNIHIDGSHPATLMMTMYDQALDSYSGGLSWGFAPWKTLSCSPALLFKVSAPYHSRTDFLHRTDTRNYQGAYPYAWTVERIYRPVMLRGNVRKYKSARLEAVMMEEEVFSVADGAIAQNTANVPKSAVAEIGVIHDTEYEEMAEDARPQGLYLRSNTSTLAFFEPALRSDTAGRIVYRFRAPDLLTQWRIEGLAWTQQLALGRIQRFLMTRKKLMVQPNLPRFVRQGDTVQLTARVSNLTDDTVAVKVTFAFGYDTASLVTLDSRTISVAPQSTAPVAFPFVATEGDRMGMCRFVAIAEGHSDGVQLPLPLLSNRMTVTQSQSLWLNRAGEKQYDMPLYNSTTSEPVGVTVEYTSNPMWLALQSLPYLGERTDPSNIYLFNSYYANWVGKEVLKGCPELLDSFADTATLRRQLDKTSRSLNDNQLPDGGWSWMPQGQRSSDYVTRYILKGLGRMYREYQFPIADFQYYQSLRYTDSLAFERYKWALKSKVPPTLSSTDLDYLYTRSFYPKERFAKDFGRAHVYYRLAVRKQYKKATGLYEQALMALVLHRAGYNKEARDLVRRLKEKALVSDEMGIYWRDNKAGYFWHQRPVETQALLIQTFREVTPKDTESIALMQLWLLKQKQTTRWGSDVATVHAVTALLPEGTTSGAGFASESGATSLLVGNQVLVAQPKGAGGLHHTWEADSLASLLHGDTLSITIRRESTASASSPSASWGAVFYQYREDMDKVPYNSTGISCTDDLYVVRADGTLKPAADTVLRVGMRLRRVLHVATDRVLEYVELSDGRAACLEPVNTASGWRWNWTGVSWYVAVGDKVTCCYIDRLEKGRYTIESDTYVTHSGSFVLAPAVLQCLYAPEFRATSPGERLTVSAE